MYLFVIEFSITVFIHLFYDARHFRFCHLLAFLKCQYTILVWKCSVVKFTQDKTGSYCVYTSGIQSISLAKTYRAMNGKRTDVSMRRNSEFWMNPSPFRSTRLNAFIKSLVEVCGISAQISQNSSKLMLLPFQCAWITLRLGLRPDCCSTATVEKHDYSSDDTLTNSK